RNVRGKRVLEPLPQCAVDSPRRASISREKDKKKQDQRDGIELSAKVTPQCDAVTCAPPARQREVEHEKCTDDRRRPNKQAEDHRGSDPEFQRAYKITKKHGVWPHNMSKHGPIERDRFRLNVSRQIFLKVPVRECGARDFVFAEQEKK